MGILAINGGKKAVQKTPKTSEIFNSMVDKQETLVRQPLLNERENSPAYAIWYHFLKNHPEYKIEDYPVAERVLFERIAIPSLRDIEYDVEYLEQILDAFRKISKHRKELK